MALVALVQTLKHIPGKHAQKRHGHSGNSAAANKPAASVAIDVLADLHPTTHIDIISNWVKSNYDNVDTMHQAKVEFTKKLTADRAAQDDPGDYNDFIMDAYED